MSTLVLPGSQVPAHNAAAATRGAAVPRGKGWTVDPGRDPGGDQLAPPRDGGPARPATTASRRDGWGLFRPPPRSGGNHPRSSASGSAPPVGDVDIGLAVPVVVRTWVPRSLGSSGGPDHRDGHRRHGLVQQRPGEAPRLVEF